MDAKKLCYIKNTVSSRILSMILFIGILGSSCTPLWEEDNDFQSKCTIEWIKKYKNKPIFDTDRRLHGLFDNRGNMYFSRRNAIFQLEKVLDSERAIVLEIDPNEKTNFYRGISLNSHGEIFIYNFRDDNQINVNLVKFVRPELIGYWKL